MLKILTGLDVSLFLFTVRFIFESHAREGNMYYPREEWLTLRVFFLLLDLALDLDLLLNRFLEQQFSLFDKLFKLQLILLLQAVFTSRQGLICV